MNKNYIPQHIKVNTNQSYCQDCSTLIQNYTILCEKCFWVGCEKCANSHFCDVKGDNTSTDQGKLIKINIGPSTVKVKDRNCQFNTANFNQQCGRCLNSKADLRCSQCKIKFYCSKCYKIIHGGKLASHSTQIKKLDIGESNTNQIKSLSSRNLYLLFNSNKNSIVRLKKSSQGSTPKSNLNSTEKQLEILSKKIQSLESYIEQQNKKIKVQKQKSHQLKDRLLKELIEEIKFKVQQIQEEEQQFFEMIQQSLITFQKELYHTQKEMANTCFFQASNIPTVKTEKIAKITQKVLKLVSQGPSISLQLAEHTPFIEEISKFTSSLKKSQRLNVNVNLKTARQNEINLKSSVASSWNSKKMVESVIIQNGKKTPNKKSSIILSSCKSVDRIPFDMGFKEHKSALQPRKKLTETIKQTNFVDNNDFYKIRQIPSISNIDNNETTRNKLNKLELQIGNKEKVQQGTSKLKIKQTNIGVSLLQKKRFRKSENYSKGANNPQKETDLLKSSLLSIDSNRAKKK